MVAYDDRSAVEFETKENLSNTRNALAAVPVLEVRIGEMIARAWDRPIEIRFQSRTETSPVITVKPDLEDVRLNMRWEGPASQGADEGFSPQIAVGRLKALLELRRNTDVWIDGAGLGSIRLNLRAALNKPTGTSPAAKRRVPWLAVAMAQGGGIEAPVPAWALRRTSALDLRILRAVSKGKDSRWTPLLLRTVRER